MIGPISSCLRQSLRSNAAENRPLEEHGGIQMFAFGPGGVKAILSCRVGSAWSQGFSQLEGDSFQQPQAIHQGETLQGSTDR